MNRILVIGSGGSGKSTLSQKLSNILNLPVIHLDAYFWNPNWVPKPNDEWDQMIDKFTNQDQWIMDGNYSRTMNTRMERADAIIFLDMPRLLCCYRIIKRRFMYHNKSRPDMNEGCNEKLDWEFVKWVWNYKKRSGMNVLKKLEHIQRDKQVIILNTRKQVDEFISRIESNRSL
ncbi:adenylate kinase family enzyme [Paenibacillus amylolyticus]|uniref:Adenylate kinase family enzyme n=1 Tax=Paenibacillus amylolyticus TaxID=1451 RepID=A0AAP5H9K3_PAEAM|nr:DNA topology modulation protein [Paenibacillus amylolyticus]MDR6726344.1 adenylate kinase family enzyme [Paenibacillus amylolyticus]